AGTVIGPALLASGWILGSPTVKVAAALVLAASHLLLAAIAATIVPRLASPIARVLLAGASCAAPVGMFLAAADALGEIWEPVSVSIVDMARVHGAANGLGFTLCGLLGWLVAHAEAPELLQAPLAARKEVLS